nr:hypothetical protein [uncultured Pseudomonas sp.]
MKILKISEISYPYLGSSVLAVLDVLSVLGVLTVLPGVGCGKRGLAGGDQAYFLRLKGSALLEK